MKCTTRHAGLICKHGFSLTELLVVVAIIGAMTVAAVPALKSMVDAGGVRKATADISGTLGMARAYAMSKHTYVRVALSNVAPTGSQLTSTLVLMAICPSDGTLDADGAADMSDATKWPALSRPILLDNVCLNDALGSSYVDDDKPGNSNIAQFSRKAGNLGAVKFTAFIQFNPSGEARITTSEPSRYIKIGIDKPAPYDGKNPCVLRLSGTNGTLIILRKGEGI